MKELKTDKTNKQTDFDDAVTAVKTDEELIASLTDQKQAREDEKADSEKALIARSFGQ